jgi:hypothetical protein
MTRGWVARISSISDCSSAASRDQRTLQVGEFKPQYLQLCGAAAQGGVRSLHGRNLQRYFRSEAPEQHFRQVMQQSGDRDFVRHPVVAQLGPIARV